MLSVVDAHAKPYCKETNHYQANFARITEPLAFKTAGGDNVLAGGVLKKGDGAVENLSPAFARV